MTSTNISVNEATTKESAQRSKEYRERNKEQLKVHKAPPRKNAQCCKEYRERKKEQLKEQESNASTVTTTNTSANKNTTKSNAQRCKEYREREKGSDVLTDFISNKKGFSIATINCQSLRKHNLDLLDSVTKNTTLLLLSETWTNNNPAVAIPNFNCVAQFQRTNAPPAAGVAIYKNNNDETNVLTPNIDGQLKNTSDINVRHTNVGDICSTICKMENGLEIVIAVIYILHNIKCRT